MIIETRQHDQRETASNVETIQEKSKFEEAPKKPTQFCNWRQNSLPPSPPFSISRELFISLFHHFYTLLPLFLQIHFFYFLSLHHTSLPPFLSLTSNQLLSSSISLTMPTIADRATSAFPGATPPKRRLRSNSTPDDDIPATPPPKWKSPRRCKNSSPKSPSNGIEKEFSEKLDTSSRSPLKKSSDNLFAKPKWNPRDSEQMSVVKEALHVSTSPSSVVCREDESRKVLEFCKTSVESKKAGSLYICGCPGTGKTMVMDKVKHSLLSWSSEADIEQPDVLFMNCTSLSKSSDIFTKILQNIQPKRKISGSTTALKHIQNHYAQDGNLGSKMMLLIIDELDYLITKDREVLHELFMLTTLPFSRCILIGIANAIDLADRFLPRLQSLNCKPSVLTFRAYSKDQIQKILQERLVALPYTVFQPQTLELCARKVAAASGDMRKALSVCRCAIEILESEIKENASNLDDLSSENGSSDQENVPATPVLREIDIVQIHHMAVALSKTYRSPVVETIQSLPQHQQIILCSAVKLFREGKKESIVGELNKSYDSICKSAKLRSVGIMELSSMCKALNDQGLLKLVRSQKGEKLSLKVDASDITFALQGVRLFRNCLQ
ncbi:cell division control protein 6 homolog B-like isoform X2 [Chenopodium quinoa]|uniref:cell division control protein 6 homolog B-like isoform X2 n=1 Tax=Chenopodium quinoa TaxID=63459 RepID=UPI000B77F69A|nr:cell division control protein 6 homolog B-like isoform X2 [Chenopodium quinoa]